MVALFANHMYLNANMLKIHLVCLCIIVARAELEVSNNPSQNYDEHNCIAMNYASDGGNSLFYIIVVGLLFKLELMNMPIHFGSYPYIIRDLS
jgi:hypothetical protein